MLLREEERYREGKKRGMKDECDEIKFTLEQQENNNVKQSLIKSLAKNVGF